MNTLGWHGRRGLAQIGAAGPVGFVEITAPADRRPGPDAMARLVFRLVASRPDQLEAIRDARRAMIREERTRGLDMGEPSLSEAVFAAASVTWEVPLGEEAGCREKLGALVRRANGLIELSAASRLRAAV